MLERGELDLGAMVIAPDAQLDARGRARPQAADRRFRRAPTRVANRLPSARAGVIKAGHYDPVRELPPTDKRVIQIDTLVIGNGCARESVTQGVITALDARVSRLRPRQPRAAEPHGTASTRRRRESYIDEDGPDLVGEHVPWVIDIMPMARWVQLVFAFSMLFARAGAVAPLPAVAHRRAARRHRGRGARSCSRRLTWPRSATMSPGGGAPRRRRSRAARRGRSAISSSWRSACRRQSLSMLVPMGQEMGYRYQEQLIADLLNVLRNFRAAIDEPTRPEG